MRVQIWRSWVLLSELGRSVDVGAIMVSLLAGRYVDKVWGVAPGTRGVVPGTRRRRRLPQKRECVHAYIYHVLRLAELVAKNAKKLVVTEKTAAQVKEWIGVAVRKFF